jgi:hypothetical protein
MAMATEMGKVLVMETAPMLEPGMARLSEKVLVMVLERGLHNRQR